MRMHDEKDAEQSDRQRYQDLCRQLLADEKHRENAAVKRSGVVEKRGDADARMGDRQEVEEHGHAPEESAIQQEIDAIVLPRGAAVARNEQHGRESDSEADHRHLRTRQARRCQLRRECHRAEHRRGRDHQEKCSNRGPAVQRGV